MPPGSWFLRLDERNLNSDKTLVKNAFDIEFFKEDLLKLQKFKIFQLFMSVLLFKKFFKSMFYDVIF